MSRTLKIVNGQLDLDSASGQVNTVEGNRKTAQDLAAFILQDHLQDNDSGSYLRAVATNQITDAGDLFIRHYVADAVQRLRSQQHMDPNTTPAEQIKDITQLEVVNDKEGTVYFWVVVSTTDGGAESVAVGQETELNHQYERF